MKVFSWWFDFCMPKLMSSCLLINFKKTLMCNHLVKLQGPELQGPFSKLRRILKMKNNRKRVKRERMILGY